MFRNSKRIELSKNHFLLAHSNHELNCEGTIRKVESVEEIKVE